MADLYMEFGDPARAASLRAAAEDLRRRFNEVFWWPEERTYYYALDGQKRPVRSVVSNFGYQVGAVWPHDNSLIALGFKRYGRIEEALRVAEGIFEAAACFQAYQLPELFAGLARRRRSFPVQYLDANIPQGWAAGAVFALLRMILGLRADAPRERLLIHPTLPPWIPRLKLLGMTLGRARFDLEVVGEGDRTRADLVVHSDRVQIVEQPWSPEEV